MSTRRIDAFRRARRDSEDSERTQLRYSSCSPSQSSGHRDVPPMSAVALGVIDSRRVDMRDVIDAYHRGTKWPDPEGHPDRHVRMLGTTSLVVADSGTVVTVRQRYADKRLLAEETPGQRRVRGGAGRRMPVSVAEIVARAKALGADVTKTRHRLRVSVPGRPGVVFLTREAGRSGDRRALRNAAADLAAKLGLDVTRPIPRKKKGCADA